MSKVSAYEEFKHKLLTGELLPGQFVTQKELAALADVPIAAAREAIQKLEHESLLKVHPQRGIQITDITVEFIRNAFGLRMSLEKDAVQKFAAGDNIAMCQEMLRETQSVLDEAASKPSEDVLERAVELDWRLHDDIMSSLNNRLITEVYQINAARLRLIKINNRLTPVRVAGALQEHIEILEHCIAQNPEGAALAMEKHINTAMDRAINGV